MLDLTGMLLSVSLDFNLFVEGFIFIQDTLHCFVHCIKLARKFFIDIIINRFNQS